MRSRVDSMKRIRLGTVMLVIALLGLGATLVIQERRIAQLEARLTLPTWSQSPFSHPVKSRPGTTPLPLPALPIEISSPFDSIPATSLPGPGSSDRPSPLSPIPSRTLPTPAAPIPASFEDEKRSLDQQIEHMTRLRDRLRTGERENANAPPPPESPPD